MRNRCRDGRARLRRRLSSPLGSGRWPVHSSCCSTAWWTSMPRPSTVSQPAASAAAQPRRAQRVVDEVGDHLAGPQQRRIGRQLGRPHADRGGVDDDVGTTSMSAAAPTRATRGERRRPRRPVLGDRLTTTMSAAPARPRASITLRAAAPAPSTHTVSPTRRRRLRRASRRSRRPSVEWPASAPSGSANHRVDAVQGDRRRREAVDRRGHRLLVRRRDRQTRRVPSVRIASSAAAAVAGGDVEGDVHPVEIRRRERRVVDRRRQAVGDRRADQRGNLVTAPRRRSPDRCSAWCCHSVAAKA